VSSDRTIQEKPTQAVSWALLGAVPDIKRPNKWEEMGFFDSPEECEETVTARLRPVIHETRHEDQLTKKYYKCRRYWEVKCPHQLCLIIDEKSGRCRLFETCGPNAEHNHPSEQSSPSTHSSPPAKRPRSGASSRQSQGKADWDSSSTSSLDSHVSDEESLAFRLPDKMDRLEELADELGLGFGRFSNSCMFLPKADVSSEGKPIWT